MWFVRNSFLSTRLLHLYLCLPTIIIIGSFVLSHFYLPIVYSRNRIFSAPSTFHSPSRKLASIGIGRNRFQIVSKARLPTSFIAAAFGRVSQGTELHFPQSVPEWQLGRTSGTDRSIRLWNACSLNFSGLDRRVRHPIQSESRPPPPLCIV